MSSPKLVVQEDVKPSEKGGLATPPSEEVVGETAVTHIDDPDAALEALKELGGAAPGETVIDAATNARLLRRIDWVLMPIMCIVYGLNFLDKTTLSYASILGISSPPSQGGIGLVGNQYNWLASVFYFGYLGWEWPTNRLLQYLPLGKYLAFNVVAWGVILCCLAGVQSYGGAVAVRFLLGVFEAAVSPGFALLTSQWYTKREQGARVGLWFSFNGFAQIFGGLVAYAVAKHAGSASGYALAPWRVIFVIAGPITIAMGVVFFFVIPDSQLNARWLSPRDRALCLERIRANQQGVGNRHWKRYQFVEALADPLTWAFVLYSLLANIPNGGLTNFFSIIIKSFGYTAQQSLLYGAPGGAVEIVALVGCGLLGDRLGSRLLVSSTGLLVAIVGMALIVGLPESAREGRLAGFYLSQFFVTPFVALLSLVSTNVAGYTKKTTVAALYFVAYCVGNIIGPQCFQARDAPAYRPAEYTFIACYIVCFADIMFIWWYCRRENARKAAVVASPGYRRVENQEWLDLTDRENPEFMYVV